MVHSVTIGEIQEMFAGVFFSADRPLQQRGATRVWISRRGVGRGLWLVGWLNSSECLKAALFYHLSCRNIRKPSEIKGSDKYVTLDVLLKFDSLDKMKITYSESKVNLVSSGKLLITSLGLKAKLGPHKYKKSRNAIKNVSKKDLSKIIREFKNYLMKVMRGRGLIMSVHTQRTRQSMINLQLHMEFRAVLTNWNMVGIF